ncbi:MAG: hypothetical protein ABUK01_12305 [Leptospirales bacterium]
MKKIKLAFKITWLTVGILLIPLLLKEYYDIIFNNSFFSNDQLEDEVNLSRLWASYIETKISNLEGVDGANVVVSFPNKLSVDTIVAIHLSFTGTGKPNKYILQNIKRVLEDKVLFPIAQENVIINDTNGNVIEIFTN